MHSWSPLRLFPLRWLVGPGDGCGHPHAARSWQQGPAGTSPVSVSDLQPRKEVLASLQNRQRGALGLLNTCTEDHKPVLLHRPLNIWVGLTWPRKAWAGPKKVGWEDRQESQEGMENLWPWSSRESMGGNAVLSLMQRGTLHYFFFFFFLWGSMKMPSNNDFTNKLQQDVRVLEKHQRVGRMHGYVLPSQFFSASPSNA